MPSPRLSWQHARAHETSWEYVHISNMTLDEVGEQAFHWVLGDSGEADQHSALMPINVPR
jgi:hypothetical protein